MNVKTEIFNDKKYCEDENYMCQHIYRYKKVCYLYNVTVERKNKFYQKCEPCKKAIKEAQDE